MDRIKKSKRIKAILSVIGLFSVATSTILLGILFFGTSETHTSTKNEYPTLTVLDCESPSPVDPFFATYNAITTSHRVKIEFRSSFFDKASFTYTATYNSDAEASTASSLLHADYNIYMGSKTGIYQEDLFPTFSIIGPKNIINLYISEKYLDSGTARLIFLDEEELNGLMSSSTPEVMQNIYEQKGFSCKITNNHL